MNNDDRWRLTDEEDEQLAYERAEIVSKIMNNDLGGFSFGKRGNYPENIESENRNGNGNRVRVRGLKPKTKTRTRARAKAKSRMMSKIDSLLRAQMGGIRR